MRREGALLRRSLLSLRDAVVEAREAGISTELVVTLDRADEVTREALRGFDPAAFERHVIASPETLSRLRAEATLAAESFSLEMTIAGYEAALDRAVLIAAGMHNHSSLTPSHVSAESRTLPGARPITAAAQ